MNIYDQDIAFIQSLSKNNYKLLSMDVGMKRIGLATYNSLVNVILPHSTFQRSTLKADLQQLSVIIRDNQINGLIIGIPVPKEDNISENSMVSYIKRFADELMQKVELPVLLVDESFSSKMAHSILRSTDLSRKKREAVDDQMAAAIILEDFVKRAKLNG